MGTKQRQGLDGRRHRGPHPTASALPLTPDPAGRCPSGRRCPSPTPARPAGARPPRRQRGLGRPAVPKEGPRTGPRPLTEAPSPGRLLRLKERPALPGLPRPLRAHLEMLLEANRQDLGHGGGSWLGLQSEAGPESHLSGEAGPQWRNRPASGEPRRSGSCPRRRKDTVAEGRDCPHLPGPALTAPAGRKDPAEGSDSHAAGPMGGAEGSAHRKGLFRFSPPLPPRPFFLPHHATEVRLRHFRSALVAPAGHVPGEERPGKVTRPGAAVAVETGGGGPGPGPLRDPRAPQGPGAPPGQGRDRFPPPAPAAGPARAPQAQPRVFPPCEEPSRVPASLGCCRPARPAP